MKKFTIAIILLTFTLALVARITVSLDGTADFACIQTAINSLVSSDTILVYPGRYFENIIFSPLQPPFAHSIVLTSMYAYTSDRSDIYNTIIDGNYQGSCVEFKDDFFSLTILNGFTLEHGSGHHLDAPVYTQPTDWLAGGGIYIEDSSPIISNCVIQNNKVLGVGGGIFVGGYYGGQIRPSFIGNVLKHNFASYQGGGLFTARDTSPYFDSISKNSIFNNLSGIAHDLFSYNLSDTRYIIPLDTFTIAFIDPVYIIINGDRTDISIENHLMDNFINHDLYVSNNGSDELNDGLTPETPFKTVTHAIYWIASDSSNTKTVFIAPGIYKPSNGELFPIQMKSFVTLAGAGPEQTIFNAENNYMHGFLTSERNSINYTVTGISFINTICSLEDIYPYNYELATPLQLNGITGLEVSNCRFINNNGGIATVLQNFDFYQPPPHGETGSTFRNLIFDNNIGTALLLHSYKATLENITIKNNHGFGQYGQERSHWAILMQGYQNASSLYTLSNVLIYSNDTSNYNDHFSSIIQTILNPRVLINNTTIAGNTVQGSFASLIMAYNSNLTIYNSIIYSNTQNNISGNYVSIYNTLLQGGQSSVSSSTVWDESNIDEDPIFSGDEMHPFQLGAGSPAINVGTPNINFPDYIWPTTDIIGNPRLTGASVDMGAYEFQELTAGFTATPIFGVAPLLVQFTDQSVGGHVFSRKWYINDEPTEFSTEQTPTYTFTAQGIYSVKLVLNDGESEHLKPQYITVRPPDSESDTTLPAIIGLTPPYPNPFRTNTTFKVTIHESGNIVMNIYNIKGQKVRTLINERKNRGNYQIVWDGKSDIGSEVASGIYAVEIRHDDNRIGTVKVSYIK